MLGIGTIITGGFPRSFDPDAQIYFDTAGIIDSTQKTAVNNLVIELKNNGVWTKADVIYPIVGGTASQHSYNLKDPSQFQTTWFNTPTHDSGGVDYNGTNEYGRTGYVFSNLNAHIAVYCVENVGITGMSDMGVMGDNSKLIAQNARSGADRGILAMSSGNLQTYTTSDSRIFIVGSRLITAQFKHYKNGIASTKTDFDNSFPTVQDLALGARNNAGVIDQFVSRKAAFYSAGSGLTDQENTDYFTAVTNFQTTLGRQNP